MCEPISIGIAIGAATGAVGAAITGQDVLTGALMGGIMGGATAGLGAGGSFGLGAESWGVNAFGMGSSFMGIAGVTTGGVLAATVGGLGTSIAMGMLTPKQQEYNQDFTGMPYTPQAYNTQHTKVTGSGGRQAAAVLASEIKQAKKLRSRQAGSEDYGLGMDLAGTGLQIA